MTGSGGSGIFIARKSDGTWSPPSGIMLHTPTLSFIIGVDVYDCVLVVNNLAALESMTKPRVTLGEDVGLTGGPSVPLDSSEANLTWSSVGNVVFAYMKARGQYQNVNLNGCILAERGNENERFYSSGVTQMDILAGNVARHVEETKPLFEVIKMAEGRSDYDPAVIAKIANQLAPGDVTISSPKSTPASPRGPFGVPNASDPDPFGVLALEMAGLEIREAGSRHRPASSQFEFNPTTSSPTTSKFSRQSVDTFVTKSNRGSYMSTRTARSRMSDAGTQTDVANTPVTTPSPGQSEVGHERAPSDQVPVVEEEVKAETQKAEEDEIDYTTIDMGPLKDLSRPPSIHSATSEDKKTLHPASPDDLDKVSKASSNYENDSDSDDTNDADDEDDLDEEPVVFEVAAVQPARTQAVVSRVVQAKGSMVNIPKRIPPPLPPRSAARASRASRSELGSDVASQPSPLRQEFSEADVKVADDEPRAVPQETSPRPSADGAPAEQATETKIDEPVVDPKTDVTNDKDLKDDDLADAESTPSVVVHEPVETQEPADTSGSVSDQNTATPDFQDAQEDRESFDSSSPRTPTLERPDFGDGKTLDTTPQKPDDKHISLEGLDEPGDVSVTKEVGTTVVETNAISTA